MIVKDAAGKKAVQDAEKAYKDYLKKNGTNQAFLDLQALATQLKGSVGYKAVTQLIVNGTITVKDV